MPVRSRPTAEISTQCQDQVTRATTEAKKGACAWPAWLRTHAPGARGCLLAGGVGRRPALPCPDLLVASCAGKALLDKMKSDGEAIASAAPKSERVQPYKSQYLTLCKGYVDAMKEHQKVRAACRRADTCTGVGAAGWPVPP